MSVSVVDMFKNVNVTDNHCKRLLAVLIDIQDLFKRTAVQCAGQRVVLGLVADDLLRLLVFAVDFVVGQCQVLQFCRAHHREDLPAPDALTVVHQRFYHQMARYHADFQHEQYQQRRAQLNFTVHAGENGLGSVLAAACQRNQAVHALGDFFVHIIAHILILVVANQLLCLAHLLAVCHRYVTVMQRDRPDFRRPARLVRQRGLRHKPHGIPIRIAQILRRCHGGFQQRESIGVAVMLCKIL